MDANGAGISNILAEIGYGFRVIQIKYLDCSFKRFFFFFAAIAIIRPPELELKNAKGLSNEKLQNLQDELTKLAAVRCGEVRMPWNAS